MKQFMPDVEPKKRLTLLQENAVKVEQTTYQKPLTPEELAFKRETLTDNCIKLNNLEDDLKDIKDGFKLKMDPMKNQNKMLLTEIKTKQSSIDGTIYHLADYDSGMMETYDSDGYLISSRRLLPTEKQGNVFALGKAN